MPGRPPVRLARILLPAAAVAIAAAAALAAPAAHAATRHPSIVWGANRNTWAKYKAAIPAARGVRIYYDNPDPSTWPTTWPARAGTPYELVSMRPEPGPLLHGQYDAYFRALFATAPAHSLLTIWHEDAVGNNPLGYSGAVRNPAVYRRMQAYMEHLTRGTRVRFGIIGCGPVNQAEQWYAPHLDWYGTDLYWNARSYDTKAGHLSRALVWRRMNANLAAWRKVSRERYPSIRIGESNAAWDSKRKAWFTDVASWFASHDGNRPAWILTYWNARHGHASGGLSGPWPPSRHVITVLRYLAAADR